MPPCVPARDATTLTSDALAAFHRANAQQPKLFVGMILILIFAEALALYGLIGECSSASTHVINMNASSG